MYIRIDTSSVPPAVTLHDQDDFTSFKVVLAQPSHAWVSPESLMELADRAADERWQNGLADMITYAKSKNWTDANGRIRAHLEVEQSPEP